MNEEQDRYCYGDLMDDVILLAFDDSLTVVDKADKVRDVIRFVGGLIDDLRDQSQNW